MNGLWVLVVCVIATCWVVHQVVVCNQSLIKAFRIALIAKADIAHSNKYALESWRKVYKNHFGIALTDTYGTNVFFKDFGQELMEKYDGVRQDSGDPKTFVDTFVQHCQDVGVDVASKVVVFSDSLNVDLCLEVCESFEGMKSECYRDSIRLISSHSYNSIVKTRESLLDMA